VGKHKDPQPNPNIVKNPCDETLFREKCLNMSELDYGITHAYLWQKRLEKQVKALDNVKEAVAWVKRDRPKIEFDTPKCLLGEEWLKQFTKFRLTHYKLLISFWESVKERDSAKTSVVVKCMGSNAGRIDEAASELVALGSMSEMDYKNVVDDTGDDYKWFEMVSKGSESSEEKFCLFREAVLHEKPERDRIEAFIQDVHRPKEEVCEIIANDTQMRLERNIDF
jgi:hypothetical protein